MKSVRIEFVDNRGSRAIAAIAETVHGSWDASSCADCGQAIVGPTWVGLTTTHRIIGPLCAHCATTD